MKRLIYIIFNEIKYMLGVLGYKKTSICEYKFPREMLLNYSDKPKGYYEDITDNPIDENVDLSIIVPMYNVENYIEDCLTSIISQDTKYTYEILCVDDGSPDKSAEIVKKIQLNNTSKNIRIITQKNRGLSGARNKGLDEAVGKYVMFVDSDDVVSSNIVERLVSLAERTGNDIVCCGFYTFDNNNHKKNYLLKSKAHYDNSYNMMKKSPMYFWGKVYKRSFWKNLRLPEGFLFEDMMVSHILTRLCNGFSYINLPLYGYRYNAQGITATASRNEKSIDQYWMTEYISEYFDKRGWVKDQEYYKKILNELGPFLYYRTKKLSENIRKCLFIVASDRICRWNIDKQQLSLCEKRLLKAYLERDFYAWQNVAKNWY